MPSRDRVALTGMQRVDGEPHGRQWGSRYERGVRSLRPDVVDSIRAALTADPAVTKSELARRVGVSRATLGYYLRGMGENAESVAKRRDDHGERIAASHAELVERVALSVEEVRGEIRKLQAFPTSPTSASAVFRGYGTLERLFRLLGELLGQVSPPTTNVYLQKVEVLLSSPVGADSLSPMLRAALQDEGADG